tara:strand:- start:193 stop:399 length:207 start_codon:yes stop_codon:yes gene_type:complete
MVIQISSKELHFAAYVKATGARLIEFNNNTFVFETAEEENALRIKHSNSEALLVDRELLTLKQFVIRR